MRHLRFCGMAIVLLVAPLLGGCLVSAQPEVAPSDLLPLPLTGDYELTSRTGLATGDGKYSGRIETVAPGSFRLTISPIGDVQGKEPIVYDFRILKSIRAGEYVAVHAMAVAEGQEAKAHYVLIRAVGDYWSVNTVEPYGDAASLLQAIQAAGLGMKLGGGYVELTGKLTGKALVDLFQNPQFVAQLSLSETWQIRPLPGQGLSPDAGALQQSAPAAEPKGVK